MVLESAVRSEECFGSFVEHSRSISSNGLGTLERTATVRIQEAPRDATVACLSLKE